MFIWGPMLLDPASGRSRYGTFFLFFIFLHAIISTEIISGIQNVHNEECNSDSSRAQKNLSAFRKTNMKAAVSCQTVLTSL